MASSAPTGTPGGRDSESGFVLERRLLIVRHAKADWSPDQAADHARPLAPRGRLDAPRVAAALRDAGWAPQHAAISDALRTRQTWEAMAPELPAASVAVHPELYHAGLRELRALAQTWSSAWTTVLALGHNPGWSEAVSTLSRQHVDLTTCNAALLVGEGATWGVALIGPWRLHGLIRPREI